MSNTVVLNLDYTFVIDPKYNNNEIITCYETHNGIWRSTLVNPYPPPSHPLI